MLFRLYLYIWCTLSFSQVCLWFSGCRNFLWSVTEGKWKIQLHSWDKVCSPKEVGALRLRQLNGSIMCLWIQLGGGLSIIERSFGCKYWRAAINMVVILFLRLRCSNAWKGVWHLWNSIEKVFIGKLGIANQFSSEVIGGFLN